MVQKRDSSQHKSLLIYIHLRLMHYKTTAILKSLWGPCPRLHFKQFKQRQKTESHHLGRQIYTAKAFHIDRIIFNDISVALFGIVVTQGYLAPLEKLWFFFFCDKSTGNLMADQNFMMIHMLPHEMSSRGVTFVEEGNET